MEGVKEGGILSGDRGLRHESMRNWKTKMEPQIRSPQKRDFLFHLDFLRKLTLTSGVSFVPNRKLKTSDALRIPAPSESV